LYNTWVAIYLLPEFADHRHPAFLHHRFIPTSSVMTESDRTNKRIDMPGALLLGASLVCLSLGLAQEAAQN